MTCRPQTALAILRRKQVEREVGLSRTTIYRRIKDGTFPPPVKLGLGSVGWRIADIDLFLTNPAGYRVSQPTSESPVVDPGPVGAEQSQVPRCIGESR